MDQMGGRVQNSLTEVRVEVANLPSQMRQDIDSVADMAQRPALPPGFGMSPYNVRQPVEDGDHLHDVGRWESVVRWYL